MTFSVVIPARYSATRLPGKPLRDIAGRPMIERVYRQASASGARQVVIATDDQRIADCARGFGAQVCMTSVEHASGTDRLQEAAAQLALGENEVVVNVQGDEPLIPPAVIDQVAGLLAGRPDAAAATLAEPITTTADFLNPNVVKVVTSAAGEALYFSRAPIPWSRDHQDALTAGGELPATVPARRHIGIYAYRVSLLNRFVTWPRALPEQVESLEQLRILWQGQTLLVADACTPVPGGVDTPEDLQRVNDLLRR